MPQQMNGPAGGADRRGELGLEGGRVDPARVISPPASLPCHGGGAKTTGQQSFGSPFWYSILPNVETERGTLSTSS